MAAAAQKQAPDARSLTALISQDAWDTPLLELWGVYCEADPQYPALERHFEGLSQAADWLGWDARQAERVRARLENHSPT